LLANLFTHTFVESKRKEDVVNLDEEEDSSSDEECTSLFFVFVELMFILIPYFLFTHTCYYMLYRAAWSKERGSWCWSVGKMRSCA
jgi:hypothetical protein